MPRVKRGVTARARHKKILALAKGSPEEVLALCDQRARGLDTVGLDEPARRIVIAEQDIGRRAAGFLAQVPAFEHGRGAVVQLDEGIGAAVEQERDDRLAFVDFDTLMLGWDEKPRPELFVQDGLHLSPEGYQLWTAVIRPYLVRPEHVEAKR